MKVRSPVFVEWVVIVFVVMVVAIVVFTTGCSSTPKNPCPEPTIKIVVQKEAVPCVVVVEPLPDLEPIAIPPWPHDADEGELRSWVLALGRTIEERMKVLEARDAAWAAKVTAHNDQLPKCADVAPIP